MIQIVGLRFGPSGVGKTSMIPTWKYVMEEGEYCFIFDFDNGLNSIRNPRTKALPKGFVSATFMDKEFSVTADRTHFRRKPNAFREAVETIYALEQGELAPDGYEGQPKVIVVDTITGLEDVAMNLALTTDKKGGFGLGGGPAQQHWGAQMRYGDEFMRVLMSGEWHVDVTAHEKMEKDQVKGHVMVQLGITGTKRPAAFPGMFDEFYHHEVNKDGRFVLRTKKSNLFDCKSRLSSDQENGVEILDEFEDITFGQEPRGWGTIVKKVNDYWEQQDG